MLVTLYHYVGMEQVASIEAPSSAQALRVDEAIGSVVGRLLEVRDAQVGDPFEALIHTMAVEGRRIVPGSQCVISVVPATRPHVFRVVAASGNWGETLIGREWPLHPGMLHGRAMLRGVPVETTDAPGESAAPEVFAGQIRTGRLVPMSARTALPDGRIGMGVVGFWRAGPEPFTDVEREIMDRFTSLVSVILGSDEARKSTQRLVDRTRLTAQVTRELSSSLDPARVMQAIVERIADLVEVDRITLTRFIGDEVEAIAGYDRSRTPARKGTRWSLTPGMRAAIERGDPVSEGDSDIPGMPREMREQLADVRRRVIVPLRTGNQVLGMLAVSRRTDDIFGPLDVDNLEQVALSAALALHNAQLFAESKEAQEKALHALLSVSDHLDARDGDGDLFERLAETVAGLVAAQRVTLWRLNGDRHCHPETGAFGLTKSEFATLRPVPCRPSGRAICDQVIFHDAVFRGRARDLGIDMPRSRRTSESSDSADAIAVAWRAGAIRLGLLAAHDPIGPGGFSDEDVWILRLAAFAAGLAWQIQAAEQHIRALGDAEAHRLHEHIARMHAMEQMKSDFLKLASHELRGPLGVVRGYYSMMADGTLEGPALERAMPVIERRLSDMNALVNEMLETARLDEGVTRLERQPQDLRAILETATAAIAPLTGAAHVLETRLPREAVVVDVDAGRVETILRNLLDNAIKFSPDGGRVRCQLSVGGGSAHVHVVDQGLGIPPEQMHRLFTRFSRLVTSENSHISGTGLGLYLSRELARLHGGDITARSAAGGGARFMLSLPLHQPS